MFFHIYSILFYESFILKWNNCHKTQFPSRVNSYFWLRTSFLLSLFCVSPPRSGVAMPFGCLTIGEKKDYNNPSEVTDKYDLGQIVKSWVSSSLSLIQTFVICVLLKVISPPMPWYAHFSGRSSVRYSEPRTKIRLKCLHVKSSWKRTGGKSARLRKMRSSS